MNTAEYVELSMRLEMALDVMKTTEDRAKLIVFMKLPNGETIRNKGDAFALWQAAWKAEADRITDMLR